MKAGITFVLPLLLLFSCSTVNNTAPQSPIIKSRINSLQEMSIKGSVASMTEYSWMEIEFNGEILKRPYDGKRIYVFNRQGYLTNVEFYGGSDSLIYLIIESKYDTNGVLLSKIDYDPKNTPGSIYTKTYDSEGNVICEKNSYMALPSSFHLYKYDKNGKTVEDNYYSNDTLRFKNLLSYDYKGYLINKTEYYGKGGLFGIAKFKNDSLGNPIEEEYFDSNGKFSTNRTNKYFYDSKNNWIRKETLDDGRQIRWQRDFKYNE